MSNLKVGRSNHASVCLRRQVYVLGGRSVAAESLSSLEISGSKRLKSVECLDEMTRCWCRSMDMIVPLSCHTAVNYKHYICVWEEKNEAPISRESFAFDTVIKKRIRKARMPQYCMRGCCVVYRDRIYVLGDKKSCFMSYNLKNGLSDSFLLTCGGIESVAWHPKIVGHRSFGPNRSALKSPRIHLHTPPNPTCSR